MLPQTPFYYYNIPLLKSTLDAIQKAIESHPNYHVHYALKANANPIILSHIQQAGFGADCVSGGEVQRAIEAGFPAQQIVYAGVGKSDQEILLALQYDILCFNVESVAELQVINEIAAQHNQVARVCLRINPDVAAHTHQFIATGKAENKFGIAYADMMDVIQIARHLEHIQLIGLHFHIGSQITDMNDYIHLCERINTIQTMLQEHSIHLSLINVGGGLGVDYDDPQNNAIPDFDAYFEVFAQHLQLMPNQSLHFELGRSIVAQCGTLIAQVLYVKQTPTKQFVILDAGMTELIRPALYQAKHKITNTSSSSPIIERYDVVGPICESSDVFAQDILLPTTKRGDIIAIHSAGAYG
ncbi:MAG: diaminopimelate decarboxylase, partial [Paludibacteraceae bacterium]|nr:diaminopimelate decarboxylase [Paludibacteraceae bacterium]